MFHCPKLVVLLVHMDFEPNIEFVIVFCYKSDNTCTCKLGGPPRLFEWQKELPRPSSCDRGHGTKWRNGWIRVAVY